MYPEQTKKSNIKRIYPLTPLQEGILFHYLNDRSLYLEQMSYRLSGSLEPALVAKTLETIFERHDILRTAIVVEEERPLQVVLNKREIEFGYTDITQLDSEASRTAIIEDYLKSDRLRSFDLKKDVLLRVRVFRIAGGLYEFVWTHSHIILDGWCIGILNREFWQIYGALAGNKPLELPPAAQYGNFIQWLQEQDAEAASAYWRNYLKGYQGLSTVGPQNLLPFSGGYNEQLFHFELDTECAERLSGMAAAWRTTLNSLLETIWAIWLSICNNTNDVVFGTVVSGRPPELPNAGQMVGLFINTVPIRIRLNDQERLTDVAKQVMEESLVSHDFHHYPLSSIQAENKKKQQYFDHIWLFENYPAGDNAHVQTLGFQISEVKVAEKTNYDFTITVKYDGRLSFRVLFNSNRYPIAFVRTVADNFIALINLVLDNPSAAIPQIKAAFFAREAGKYADPAALNGGFPEDVTVVDLFERQARQHPGKTAIVFDERRLTYAQVEEKANKMANFLRSRYAIAPGDFIGLMLPRSEHMVVYLLGIIKSGAAYIPMDPDYPRTRIEYMINDAKVRLLIADGAVKEQFPDIADIIDPGELEEGMSTFASTPPAKVNTPADLLYVIYTSGSTGAPKGVMVTHQNVVRLLFNDGFQFKISHEDVWTLFHSIAFDFSVWEMFGALLYGGRLVVVPQEAARDPRVLVDLLEKEQVTVLNQIPTVFASVFAEVFKRTDRNLSIRYVIFGGEALLPEMLKEWHGRFPHVHLINMYGITETTVHVTFKEILQDDIRKGSSNIGKPLPTLDVYILNESKQPVPFYCMGEICVSGYGLSNGYLNNKSLTEERFIPSHLVNGHRIYLSGDLGYRIETGEIIYAGRKDEQVKIRGYRIETGEIENWILRYKGVTATAVAARKDDAGDNVLVAYLVGSAAVDTDGLRAFLRSNIPEYMIPAVYMQLESMPFTASGKVDKKALPAPGPEKGVQGKTFVSPVGEIEETVAGIWENILGVRPIGRHHDFFHAGGDSVKAIRVVAHINRALGVNTEVKDVFLYAELKDLCSYIGSLAAGGPDRMLYSEARRQVEKALSDILADRQLAKLLPPGWEDCYPMSDIEQGMIYHGLLGKEAGIYIDQLYYQFSEPRFNEEALRQALMLLAQKHEILRTSFSLSDFSVAVQIVHSIKDLVSDLRMEDIRHLQVEGQRRYLTSFLEDNKVRPFSLNKPGLWRVVVFRLSDNEYGMMWTCHHAILDGWSMAALMTELSNVYIACKNNTIAKLPPLACSYKDYVIDQFIAGTQATIRDYWKKQLDGYQRHWLPFCRKPQSTAIEKRASGYEKYIDASTADKINALAGLTGTSQREVFLAGFLFLLWMTTNTEEIITGLVTHGRPEVMDGDAVLGCFLNTVPFLYQFNKERVCRELINEVRERCRELKSYDKLSLKAMSEIFNENRKAGNPFFDILFSYVDFHVYHHFNNKIDNKQALVNHSVSTNTYLDFNVEKRGAELIIYISYEESLYTREEVALLTDYYLRILRFMHDCPDSTISGEAILTNVEKQRLLFGYNNTTTTYPRDVTIAGLFEEQAGRIPDVVAVIGQEGALTYDELNKRSNQLAHYLRKHYAPARDEMIGVMLERSSLSVAIALLGVLKSGAAYLPIDSNYPESRISYMLQDSRVNLLMADHTGTTLSNGRKTLVLPEIWDELAQYPCSNPEQQSRSSDLAYVMYTSGSTGKPKGVMIEQRSVVRLVKNTNYYDFSVKDRLLLTGALSFDATTFEIWGMLLNGGRLHLVSYNVLLDIRLLKEKIQAWEISVMWFTSSWFNQLVEEDISLFKHLRTILVGGDRLSPAHIKKVKDAYPLLTVINGYGPTENTTFSVCYRIDEVNNESIPIGLPISNSQVYVLDNQLRIVPENVEGDIYLGGDGLARGYLGEAADNTERFFSCTLADDVRARLYKTGDIGKWRSDGLLEFSGRKDNKVKVRGYRIETAEIEYYLNLYESVRSSYVTVTEKTGYKELIAYLVASPDLTTASLRAYLAESLPDYMIPAIYVNLDSFPLDANGKLDHAALQSLYTGNLKTGTSYETARDPIEARLVNIWEQVLERDGFGVNDNFYDLGGNSLKIIKLHNKVSKDFEIELSVADFFKYNTISQLGAFLREGTEKPSPVSSFDV